ncbi:hypothetical protein E2C01_074238 [Portunus trituberculatus]|uniref:Uncharacterized protein n=1 Tax=Portunus trituberculatus TaxID=210409 RepID=A0A5B7IDT3_PORTR|nr:hypothetical protein [Portunus trituberculatus]
MERHSQRPEPYLRHARSGAPQPRPSVIATTRNWLQRNIFRAREDITASFLLFPSFLPCQASPPPASKPASQSASQPPSATFSPIQGNRN